MEDGAPGGRLRLGQEDSLCQHKVQILQVCTSSRSWTRSSSAKCRSLLLSPAPVTGPALRCLLCLATPPAREQPCEGVTVVSDEPWVPSLTAPLSRGVPAPGLLHLPLPSPKAPALQMLVWLACATLSLLGFSSQRACLAAPSRTHHVTCFTVYLAGWKVSSPGQGPPQPQTPIFPEPGTAWHAAGLREPWGAGPRSGRMVPQCRGGPESEEFTIHGSGLCCHKPALPSGHRGGHKGQRVDRLCAIKAAVMDTDTYISLLPCVTNYSFYIF